MNPDLIISSEVEITHVMDGLKAILFECLGIESNHTVIKEEFNYMKGDGDDENQTFGQKLKNLFSNSEFNA